MGKELKSLLLRGVQRRRLETYYIKREYVYFSQQALLDLESYLNIRDIRYVPEKS